MNWSDERYVRLYTRDTTDWLLWSWQARALFCLILRKVDRAGVLEFGARGSKALAAHVAMPWDVVEPALAELVESGTVRVATAIDGIAAGMVIPGFLDAQRAVQTDRVRQEESRAKRRVSAITTASHDVTKSHAPSQGVTVGHAVSQDVTPSLAVPSLAVPEKKARTSRATAIESADQRRVTDAFQAAYLARTGEKPTWADKQIGQVRYLLGKHDAEKIIRHIGVLFTKPPSFLSGVPDIGTLVQHFDKLAEPTSGAPRDVRTGYAAPLPSEAFKGGKREDF